MLDFFSMLTDGGMPRYPWEMDPTDGAAPWRAPEAVHQYFRPDILAPHPPGYGPLGPLPGRQSGGGIPYMTAADAGGGGDDAPGQPPVLRGTGSGPDGMLTADEYRRQLAQMKMSAPDPAAPSLTPPAPERPVPRSLSPELYRPLNLTSTMPPAGPVPPGAPPGPAPVAAPPGPPGAPPMVGPKVGPPPGAPAVPGVLQPKPGGIFGGLFGGMLGGQGATGPDGKELTTEQMMDRYLRMQMQRAMMPDFGKMAAAFAEAGKPSLLPTGGMGAAIGKAAGAMSGGGDAKDAFAMMKIAQEIQDMRDKGAGRKAIAGKVDQFIELVGRRKSGGAAPAAPSSDGSAPVKIQPLSGEAAPADSSYGDYGGGGDAISAPDTSPHPVDIIPKYESGGRNIEQQVVGPGGGYNPSVGRVTGPSSASGYWQMLDSTYQRAAAQTAPVQIGDEMVDPTKFRRAMEAPYWVQREVAKTLYNQRGYADWAPYNKNLRAALARGEGPPSGGPQLASADGSPRVRIQPLSGAAAPAGGPSSADNDYEDSLALLLAQLGAQASTYGLGDTVKPLETWFYNRPEYAGRKAGAETAAREREQEPYRVEGDERKSRLDTAREKAAEVERRTSEREKQDYAAGLNIVDVPWELPDGTKIMRKMTQAEYARMLRGEQPGSGPLPSAAPPSASPPLVPTAPGSLRSGGALPLAQPLSAPGGAAAAPAGSTPPGGRVADAPIFTKGEEEIGTGLAKNFIERRGAAADAAQSIANTHGARKLLDTGIYAGTGSDLTLGLAKLGNSLGLTGADTKETVANTEAFVAQRGRDVLTLVKALGAGTSISNADRDFAEQIAGGRRTLDEASIRKILDMNEKYARQLITSFNKDAAKVNPRVTQGYPLLIDEPGQYQPPERTATINGKRHVVRNGQWVPADTAGGQ